MKKAIVILSKDISFNILNYYNSLDIGFDIYVVSPNIDNKIKLLYSDFIFFNDNDIFNRQEYPKIELTSRPNWYFQQILKYKIILMLSEKYCYDWVHIIDGDTYVTKHLILSDKIYFTAKNIEKPYQNFIDYTNLNITENKNFITNQMCYKSEYLKEMLTEICGEADWANHFLDLVINYHDCWFSEYQIYACYVKYHYSVEEKPVKIFRRLDLISISVYKAFRKYEIIAEEFGHRSTLLHKLRAKLYYLLGINIG